MLYPENHLFLSDLLSYVAVGARSVENQQHRLVASGLDVPVGMKNPTGGDISVMMNSIKERSVRYSKKLFCISKKLRHWTLRLSIAPKGMTGILPSWPVPGNQGSDLRQQMQNVKL